MQIRLLPSLLRAALSACAFVSPVSAIAQIYANENAAGAVVLSNFRSNETPHLLIAPVPEPPVTAPMKTALATPLAGPGIGRQAITPELRRIVDETATQVGVSAELLHAVITVESSYDVRAVSRRGAIGLMQVLPATARRFGHGDLYEPRDNVMAGASYLKWLMSLFPDDLPLVLAAYNAGEQAVLKAGRRIPPYPETQAYVPKVLSHLRCMTAEANCPR